MKRISLDPRTKFLLWMFTSVALLLFMKGHFKYMILLLYAVLFVLAGQYRALVQIAGGFVILFLLVNCIMPALPHALSFLLAMVLILYLLYPCYVGAEYLIRTTSVGEMTDAFRRMHVPETACVMSAVILRFIPAVREEGKNIRAAMKLRRIRGWKRIECTYVPLLVSIGETASELGDSITARGIENPSKKTSWHQAGFHTADALVLAACICILILSVREGTIL